MGEYKQSAGRYLRRKTLDGEIIYDVDTRKVYRDGSTPMLDLKPEPWLLPNADPRAPIKVYFDFTYLCNLECRHCITNSSARVDRREEMSLEQIFSVMDDLSAIGVMEIAVGGGEPFCHPDLIPLIEHAKSVRLNVVLTTNGTLVRPEIALRLSQLGVSEVRVSFDGEQTCHESIRGTGTYHKAIKAVRILLDAGVTTVPRITLCRDDKAGLDALLRDLAATGATSAKVAVVFPRGRATLKENEHLFSFQRNHDTVKYLIESARSQGIDVKMAGDLAAAIRPELADGKDLRHGKRDSCGAGFDTAYISPCGTLQPCSGMPGWSLGNVRDSFISAWTSSKAENWRQFTATHDSWFLCGERLC